LKALDYIAMLSPEILNKIEVILENAPGETE